MPNEKLVKAKKSKNDEFYTQFEDIQNEINAYIEYNPDVFKGKTVLLPCDDPEWSNFTRFFAQNFENFGLKKLISTSFARNSVAEEFYYQPTLFETESPLFDSDKTKINGKIFTLTQNSTRQNKTIDIDSLSWDYLEGNGDFRSEEVKKLRDEADIIVTNPPFSLFREFIAWVIEGDKNFVLVGHQNAITYKEIFQLLKHNKMWLGKGFKGGATHFINKHYTDYAAATNHIDGMIRVSGVVWFTNLEHGKRHQSLRLMTKDDNLKYSKHKQVRDIKYPKYENYDAVEVSFTDAIPCDYTGVMGVPVTFLDKYNPDLFEIIALGIVGSCEFTNNRKMEILAKDGTGTGKFTYNAKGTLYRKYDEMNDSKPAAFKDVETGELYSSIYARILIRSKQNDNTT